MTRLLFFQQCRQRNAYLLSNIRSSPQAFLNLQHASTRNPYFPLLTEYAPYRCFATNIPNNVQDSTADPVVGTTISRQKKDVNYLTAFSELSKLKLSALVVSTTSAGFLAAGGPISFPTLAACTIGTALCSSSASTFNQVYEYDRDCKMKRTRNRPLPQGVFTPTQAFMVGCTTGISGGTMLYYGVPADPTTALLGVGNIGLYAGLYTYLKPRSEWNTWAGALVGAIPPVMGWVAAGGSVWDIEAALLGGTLFLWQFPHFFALSWMHRVDYARGGFQMVPVNDPNGDRTSDLITRYTWYLSTVPFIATITDVTSSMFAIEGIFLNGYALYVAHKFKQDRSNQNARKVFLTSLWYLPSLMTLFILHSKTWREDEKIEDGDVRSLLKEKIQYVREKGKELCLHEAFSVPTFNSKTDANHDNDSTSDVKSGTQQSCPVVLGKSKVHLARKSTETMVENVPSLEEQKDSLKNI